MSDHDLLVSVLRKLDESVLNVSPYWIVDQMERASSRFTEEEVAAVRRILPIRAVEIEFTFTEASETLPPPFRGVGCWERANRWLRTIKPPDLGYYKTDFTVTFADGETYEGRYDIGADRPTLQEHITCFLHGIIDLGHWDASEDVKQELREFRDCYDLGGAR